MRYPLFVLLVLLAAACDDDFDRTKTECGFPGNCCWADLTCNESYVCNPATKLCEIAPEAGVADVGAGDSSSPDRAPTTDAAPALDLTLVE